MLEVKLEDWWEKWFGKLRGFMGERIGSAWEKEGCKGDFEGGGFDAMMSVKKLNEVPLDFGIAENVSL